jgi:hypothetical protein
MRAYWILPNRNQGDDVLASDGEKTLPLRQVLDPRRRPDGFSHGVPTELLERIGPRGTSDILFAQRFPRWDGEGELFSVLSPAGTDSSGRIVHIGLLFLLSPRERPKYELSFGGLSDEDKAGASALIRRLTSPGRADVWAESVRELLDVPADAGPATNVALERSVTQFHSLYALRAGELTKNGANRPGLRAAALILSIVFVLAGVWSSVHARDCAGAPRHSDQSAARSGEVTWRSS